MSLGNSFASFVNGFVGGRDVRDRWEDRKIAQERQKVLDEYEAERQKRLADMHGWAGEQHGWNAQTHRSNMTDAQHRQRLAELGYQDTMSTRSALEQALAAAEGGLGAPPPPGAATGPAPAPGPASMQFAPAMPDALGAPPAPGAQAAPAPGPVERAAGAPTVAPRSARPEFGPAMPGMEAGQPPALGARPAPAQAPDDLFIQNPDGTVTTARPPRTPEEARAIAEAARAGRLRQSDESAERQGQIDAAGNARQQESAIARNLRLDEGNEWGGDGQLAGNIAQVGRHINRAMVKGADYLGNTAIELANTPIRKANAMQRWATGEDAVSEIPRLDTLNRKAPAFPDAPATLPKDADETQAAAATGAANVVDQVSQTPAGAAALEGMPELGAKPGQSLTPAQIERGATGLMQSYRDNGLPIITKELMRQGRFEEAESLRSFVSEAAAQEGMKAWSGAVFRALMGDVDGAASGIIDAYNSAGYFDDGLEIVKDQTELIRADDGQVMGVKLAMRDQASGEVTVEQMNIENLIERGLWLLSPEQAAQNYLAQRQAVRAQLAEQAAEQRSTGRQIILEGMKADERAALEIYKAHIGLDGQPSISFEEARALAVAQAQEGEPEDAEDDEPPMLRRPTR
ncbi:hypothetical protein [Paracoccus sp. NSM]|uniref:hypothetical protein n=1 Tax=Paracoccus sp. NSM TaxID=3457784 RepID=UPI004035A98C